MKTYHWALVLLLSSPAWAQTVPASPKAPASTSPKATQAVQPVSPSAAAQGTQPPGAEVPPETAIITIEGMCRAKDTKTGECKTVITRAQFEKLLDAVAGARPGQPTQIPPQGKRQLAVQYSRTLLFAAAAEKQGLENTAEAQELFRVMRLQVLEREMIRAFQQKAQPTPEQIQKYRDENQQRFTELTLERIMVPIRPQETGKTSEPEMKKLAEELRQRAVAGGDFKALQAEAFEKAGLQYPPETKMVAQASTIPPSHQAVLQLKPGEVSEVIQDATGFYIYKLQAQRQVPLDQVKAQIQNTLAAQNIQQEIDNLLRTATTTLNPQYFGQAPPAPAGAALQVIPGGSATAPPPVAPPTSPRPPK